MVLFTLLLFQLALPSSAVRQPWSRVRRVVHSSQQARPKDTATATAGLEPSDAELDFTVRANLVDDEVVLLDLDASGSSEETKPNDEPDRLVAKPEAEADDTDVKLAPAKAVTKSNTPVTKPKPDSDPLEHNNPKKSK